MSVWEENSIIIERYLDGDLSASERSEFEARLENNDKLKKDLAFHKSLRADISESEKRKVLRQKLEQLHEQYFTFIPEGKVISIKKRSVFSIVSIAATISILITAGAISIYHFNLEKKLSENEYKETDRPIENKLEAPSATEEKDAAKNNEGEPTFENSPSRAATAFALTTDGWVLASYHTVKDKKDVVLEMVGDSLKSFHAEVRFFNKKLDIAIIKINDKNFKGFANLPYIFTESESIIAEKVFTLGYPKDDVVYTEGTLASLTGFHSDSLAYQAGININPGNSGAPLFNQNGEVIGIIAGKHGSHDGTAYAIKSKYFMKVLKHLKLDEEENPVSLPTRNQINGKKPTDQVKQIAPYVFIIKA